MKLYTCNKKKNKAVTFFILIRSVFGRNFNLLDIYIYIYIYIYMCVCVCMYVWVFVLR